MAYRVLYREWRPQDFLSLVGQDHISKTLQNAIRKGRIAHAYLFTGPRGTGKTSTAKILAKAVNCEALSDGEPCNNCINCTTINEGRSLDVVEIDAASNRGIDEIRDLRERVSFVPTQGKYKVYIIDEVHMLTTEAFNALLKTLEEPPGHVLFILATTEPHRIPATILSRCQRFDFRKISPAQIEQRLREILAASGLIAEEAVLAQIIRKADGGLRDAISILDQCISFSNESITLETAYEVLGIVKNEALTALTQAYIDKDAPGLLVQVNNMLREGIEPGQIIKDYLEYLRSMILLMVCGEESTLVIGSSAEKEGLLLQAKALGMNWLSNTTTVLAKIDSESRWRQNMRIVLETTLLALLLQEEVQEKRETAKEAGQLYMPQKQETFKNIKKPTAGKEIQYSLENNKPSEQNTQNTAVSGDVPLDKITDSWEHIMETIKERKKTAYAFLTVCEPREVRGNTLVLAFKSGYTFHKEKIEEQENKKLVEEVLEKVLDIKLNIKCNIEDDTKKIDDPVKKVMDIFGPDIVTFKD